MDDPVANFLQREDGALDDADIVRDVPAVNGVADAEPVQNGIHRTGDDSGVDLAAQDTTENINAEPLSNGEPERYDSTTFEGRGSSPVNSIASSIVREEPETIKKWREEHEKLLQEKDEAEQKQKVEMQSAAKKELIGWMDKHKADVAERKKKNREIEKEIQKDTAAAQKTNGDGWPEVAKLVEAGSVRQAANKNAADTSRMKSLILERKNETVA